MEEPFPLGVNYWPRRKAMYWWADFDRSEVADEFDVIAGLGLGVVRIFLLWDDWQPDPATVDRQRLQDLEVVAGAAADRNLRLDVTFFTGHMSGPNWAPGWLLDPAAGLPSPRVRQVISGGRIVDSGYHNMIHHPEAVAAAEVLLQTVVGHFADHPGVWMWNLGNEPDLFAYPESPTAGRDWVRRMTGIIKDLDPIHPVTCGLHLDSLVTNNGFRVDQVFSETDVAVMHAYPMYADWARNPLDPDFMPFICALVTALSGKPCLAEEWGGCTNPDGEESVMWEWTSFGEPRRQFMAGERELAEHVEEVLPGLVSVGAPGALMWCFADYAETLWDRPPCDLGGARHERHFGLVRPDGSLKPHAESLARFAGTRPVAKPATRRIELDLSPEEYYQDPARHARRLYAHFLEP
ncbi:MAG TPA: glycoside hydrolase family 2 TIM barrel-domain containing protein [Acidimicrobiia bacterium]|nr:glycoside hydrolase family 2 TIM barrel-domain containing protein [Acidimicrobiia bacterium]